MFRDDKDAADALAESLRRDNAELTDHKQELEDENEALERENARLRAELAASRPKETPASHTSAASKPAGAGAMWPTRIIVGVMTSLVSVLLTLGYATRPMGEFGERGLDVAIGAAVVNLIWSQGALPHVLGPKRAATPGAVVIALGVVVVMLLTCGVVGTF